MPKPTLKAAIEAAEKATPGPFCLSHRGFGDYDVKPIPTGIRGQFDREEDAKNCAFWFTHGLAILRALEKSKAALDGAYDAVAIVVQNARTIPDPRMDDATDVSAVPFEDIEGLHGPMSECRKALAAIGELFEEEGGDAS